MSNEARLNGAILVNTALNDAAAAKAEVVGSLERANMIEREARRQAEAKASGAAGAYRSLQIDFVEEKQAKEAALAALAMKEALLKEWMHSNEAFKRLARKYGKKLGVSDEQRVNDYDDVVLEIAEEKPEFADTKTLKEVKEARGMK